MRAPDFAQIGGGRIGAVAGGVIERVGHGTGNAETLAQELQAFAQRLVVVAAEGVALRLVALPQQGRADGQAGNRQRGRAQQHRDQRGQQRDDETGRHELAGGDGQFGGVKPGLQGRQTAHLRRLSQPHLARHDQAGEQQEDTGGTE